MANAGYAVGAGIAAIGLAVGTREAYAALILGNALSFVLAAVLVWRTHEPRAHGHVVARSADVKPAASTSPWRDRHYLRFVLLDIPMNLDDSILNVGLPLWLVDHTSAPHAIVPAFLAINTVLVVILQLHVSARVKTPRQAAGAVLLYGLTLLACCVVVATATGGGAWTASIALLAAALLITTAELFRSVSSWELAVSLAPQESRASYLGVAGMAGSIQKSLGPLLLTGAVMTAGPAGWLVLGGAVAGLSVAQRRLALSRLDALLPAPEAAAVTGRPSS